MAHATPSPWIVENGALVEPSVARRLGAGRRQRFKLCGDGVGRLLESHRVGFEFVREVSEAAYAEPLCPLPQAHGLVPRFVLERAPAMSCGRLWDADSASHGQPAGDRH